MVKADGKRAGKAAMQGLRGKERLLRPSVLNLACAYFNAAAINRRTASGREGWSAWAAIHWSSWAS